MNEMERVSENIVFGVYSIYDEQLEIYNPPFFARTDVEAVKVVRDDVKNIADGILNINADIFTLCRLGYANLNSGALVDDFKRIVKLIDFKDVKEV